jgi:hypothetical protein
MWRVKKNWDENKMAEIDWIQGFMKRHVYLSMRKPENTSLPRALSFNQSNVAKFYKNLQEVLFNIDFKPSNVFNIDESNMGTTVLNPPKVIAPKGKNHVGQMASASVNSVPPVFIFPRVKFKEHFMAGAPTDSLGLSNKSDWMTAMLFVEVLCHLRSATNCSIENPILLLIENHESHDSIEAIEFSRDNGITILTFPPQAAASGCGSFWAHSKQN